MTNSNMRQRESRLRKGERIDTTDTGRTFFVHVQRTGGTSLRRMIESETGDVYPSKEVLDQREGGRYVTPNEILDRWNELPRYRFLFGHCLASFCDLLPERHRRAAFLRDPIARSISITQLHAVNTGRTVSDLVDDPQFLKSHIVDMQTRVLGHGVEYGRSRPQETPVASDCTLEGALLRLRTFEFVGLMENYLSSLRRFDTTFGTNTARSPLHDNSSQPGDVPESELAQIFSPLVERDMELYQWAVRYVESEL